MITGIAGFSSQPHVVGLPPGIPDSVADELTFNVAAEDRLAQNALERLGERLPVRSHPPLQKDFSSEFAEAALAPARRPTHVPVGTAVVTGPGHQDAWYVIGTHGDNVRLAQRTVADDGFRTTIRSWSSLVERNPHLLDAPITDALGNQWMPAAVEGVELLGRRAPVGLISMDDVVMAMAMGSDPSLVPTTWDDVLRATELARRRPIAVAPRTELDVARLRDIVGDDRFIVSALGKPSNLRGALVGTETMPGRTEAILKDAAEMQAWFHDKVGIDIWNDRQNAVLFTDSSEHLANAAAAAVGDDALVYEGPRSQRVRGSWLSDMSGDLGQYVRRFSKMIAENNLAVRTHEAGHVATMRTWGRADERLLASATLAQYAEDGVVQEAFSDMLGAARTGKATVGVRDLGRLRNGWADLDQLRASFATMTPETLDVHSGTQLLTKPLVRLLKEQGGDSLAEITGAAIRDIGRQIKGGSLTAVDLPTAAKALREATAWRHGADSQIVKHLDTVWKTLGVLR